MAKYENQINYKITTTYDSKGVQQLMNNLTAVQQKINQLGTMGLDSDRVAAYNKEINTMNSAILTATDSFGKIDGKKLNKALTDAKFNATTFGKALDAAGSSGVGAATSIIGGLNKINTSMKQTSVMAQKIMNTLGNTIRWGLIATAFQGVLSNVQKAASYVKALDESLTQITMVSGESRDNMKEFAAYANTAARALGSATTDYTNAVKVFIQEGFNLQESIKQATQATILGNVSEQDTATTADQITAYRNAFHLSIEDMYKSLDKLANIANKTAANVNELMVAAQKSASTAASVGASEDSFLASIATIQSVTREAAENIGNGLKSIYTRLADVKMGKTTEDGVGYGQYSSALKSAGVDILDSAGNVKTMDQILTELQKVWQTLDTSKKLAVGEKVAGRFQYNRFAALMNNAEYYEKAFAATQGADGAMERMQEDYMQGIEAMTQRIASNFESIFTAMYNSGAFEAIIGFFTKLTDILGKISDIVGSGAFLAALGGLTTLVMRLGKTAISENVANMIINRRERNATNQMSQITRESIFGQEYAAKLSKNATINNMVVSMQGVNKYQGAFSQEQLQQVSKLQDQLIAKSAKYAENQTYINDKTDQLVNLTEKLGVSEGTVNAEVSKINKGIQEAEKWQEIYHKEVQKTIPNIKEMTKAQNKLENNEVLNKYGSVDKARQAAASMKDNTADITRMYGALTAGMNPKDFSAQMKMIYGEVGDLAENALTKLAEKEKLTSEATEQLNKDLKNISENSVLFSNDTKKLAKEVLELQNKEKLTAKETEILTDKRKRLAEALAKERMAFQQLEGMLPKDIKQLIELARQSGFAENEIKQLVQSLERMAKQGELQASIQRVTSLIGTLGSSVMNLVMIISAGKEIVTALFEDEEKTLGERIGASLMPLSMLLISLPMLMSEMTKLKNIINDMKIAFAESTAEKQKQIAINKLLAASNSELTLTDVKEILATQMQTDTYIAADNAKKKDILVQALVDKGLQEGIATKVVDTAVTDANTTSIWANIKARMAMHPVISGVVIALAALLAIATALYFIVNRDEFVLKRLKKQVQETGDQVNSAKDKLIEFNEALEEMEEHEDAFKELSKGTKEYNDAILEANQNTRDFLDTYEDILKDFIGQTVTIGENGELVVTKEAKDFVQDQLQEQETAAIIANSQARAAQTQQELKMEAQAIASRVKGVNASDVNEIVQQIISGSFDFDLHPELKSVQGDLLDFAAKTRKAAIELDSLQYAAGQTITSFDESFGSSKATDEVKMMATRAIGQAFEAGSVQYDYGYDGSAIRKGYGTSELFVTEEEIKQYAAKLGYTSNFWGTKFKDKDGNKISYETMASQAYAAKVEGNLQAEGGAQTYLDKATEAYQTLTKDNPLIAPILDAMSDGVLSFDEIITDNLDIDTIKALQQTFDNNKDSFAALGITADMVTAAFGNLTNSIYTNKDTGDLLRGEAFTKVAAEQLEKTHKVTGVAEAWSELGISEENQIKLMDLIDWSASPEEIAQQLAKYETNEAIETALQKTRVSAYELANEWGGDAKEIEGYAEHLQDVALISDEVSDVLADNQELALKTANATMRLSKGFEAVTEKGEEWQELLKEENRDTYEYYQALDEVRGALKNITGIDTHKFSADFIEKNLEDIIEAADGSIEALDRLRKAATLDFVQNMTLSQDQSGEDILGIDDARDQLLDFVETFSDAFYQLDEASRVDFEFDDTVAIEHLNELLAKGMITSDQLQDMFDGLGWQPELDWQIVKQEVPSTIHYTMPYEQGDYVDANGKTWVATREISVPGEPTVVDTAVPMLKTSEGEGGKTVVKGAYTSSKSTTPKSTKGGGGGGKKKAKTYDYDRYEQVNNRLDLNASRLEDLAKNQDRLSGKDLTENLIQQNALLEEQIELEKEKNEIRRGELAEVQAELANYGVEFDEDGIITNWKQIIEKMNREAEIHIDDEDYIEYLDSIQKYYETYNKLDDEIIKANKQIADLMNQVQDKLLEAFKAVAGIAETYKEMRDNLQEVEDSWAHLVGTDTPLYKMEKGVKRINDLIKDNTYLTKEMSKAFQNAASSFTSEGNNPGTVLANKFVEELSDNGNPLKMAAIWQQMAQEGFKRLQSGEEWNFFGTTFTEDDYESVKEFFDYLNTYLNDMLSDLNDSIDSEIELFQDEVSRMTEEFERQADALDHINDNIDYYAEVMEAIYGDNAIDTLIALDKQKIDNIDTSLGLYQQQMAQNTRLIEEYENARTNYEEGSEHWLELTEQIYDLQDGIIDLQDKYNDALKEQLELLKDIADKQVRSDTRGFLSNIIPDYEYNFKNWELLNENEEDWLDLGNRAYELQKLNNRYTDALDNAASPAAQKKINDMMQEELKMLREKNKLSQYDIDFANKKLDLLEKQLALEDAQMNKATMRLRRDSQGNYSYVYSANEDEIKKAQEEALDAWNELYNLARDRSKEIKEEAINAAQEFEDKIAEIANNLNLSAEERMELTQLAIENFRDKMAYITDQSRKNMNDLTEAISHDSEKIGLSLENAGAFNYIETLGEITTAYLPAIQAWSESIGAYADNPEEMTNNLIGQIADTITYLDDALQDSKVKIDDAIGGPDGIQTNIDAAKVSTEELFDAWNDEKWDNIAFADNLKIILDLIKAIKAESPELADEWQQMIDDAVAEEAAKKAAKEEARKEEEDRRIQEAKEKDRLRQKVRQLALAMTGGDATSPQYQTWYEYYARQYSLASGGYTGTWFQGIPGTDNGRWAILHQKELVLNEDQTKDILKAAQLVKSMTAVLQNVSLGNIGLGSVLARSDFSQPIEQSVVINADFPAAESAAEIRMALEDLANQASMYAFRTR